MTASDLSEKRRKKWFSRLQASRQSYFFQGWLRNRKSRRYTLKKLIRGFYGDLHYIFIRSISIVAELVKYGPLLKNKCGVSYFHQARKMAYLAFVLRARPKRFRTHHLFFSENWEKVNEFTYGRHDSIHRAELGYPYIDEIEILNNKLRFFEFCRSKNFKNPEILAVFEHGKVVYPASEKFTIPSRDLFIKDLEGGLGSGVRKFSYDNGEFHDLRGNKYSPEEIFSSLIEYSKKVTGTLVQQTVKNREEWIKFSNGSLATCRIVTARSARNDDIIPMFASFRMPFGNSDADNFSLGGIAAAINIETGILGDALAPDLNADSAVMDFHPDTSAKITGEKLYGWEELVEFAKKIHNHFKTLSIGWDIALTENGWSVIEGNLTWGSNIIEVSSRTPLLYTIYPELFEEWVEKSEIRER